MIQSTGNMPKRIPPLKILLNLSLQLAQSEFKLRNEGSYLGILWYLLNPILTFALLYLIFSDRLGNTIPYYPLYLLLGIIMFNLFQSTTLESTRSIIQEHHLLIKSIRFPRQALIVSILLKNLFSHLFEILLFMILMLFLHLPILTMLSYLCVMLFFLAFILGVSLALSSLTVFFVDLDNIWNFAVRLVWFGTPIFYAIGDQARLLSLNLFNPVYYFITAARDLTIYRHMPEAWILWGVFGWSIGTLAAGLLIFRSLDPKIAELI